MKSPVFAFKIEHLLDIFVNPNCHIPDKHLRVLLPHLKNKCELIRPNPIYTEWLMKTVTLWHIGDKTPTTSLTVFTLNLASILAGDEILFCSLNNNNFFINLINVVKARDSDASPTIQLAFINLLRAFLEHKAGVEWIMATVFWEDVFNFSLSSQNAYIIRESRNFMTKILQRSVEHNEKFCTNVVKKILCPLGENVYQAMKKNLTSDEDTFKNISPTLQLIGTILENFLENSVFGQKQFTVVLIFSESFHLEKRIYDLLLIAENQYLLFDLGRIMFIMQFLELYINHMTHLTNIQNIHESVRKIMDIFNSNLKRGNFDNVLKFSYFGQFYWNLLGSKLPCWMTEEDNEPLQFANELIMILLFPLFYALIKYGTKSMKPVELEQLYDNDNVRYSFVSKVLKSMSQDTTRICLNWRDCLVRQPDLCEITTKSLLYLLKSRKYIKKRELAVIVCQMSIYLLKDLTGAMRTDEEKLKSLRVEDTFFASIFEAIATFLQDFKITWKDAGEIFDVLDITFGFLEMPSWSDKVVVKGLNLVQISIDKYMAPNLAFLVDDSDNSTTGVLAPLLLSKLEDSSPNVKNAALEIVQTISKLSKTNPNCSITDHHLRTALCQFKKNYELVRSESLYTEWVMKVVTLWHIGSKTPTTNLSAFTLNLASVLSGDEIIFCSLNNNNFFVKLINVAKARDSDAPSVVQSAYINLLWAVLEHKAGVEWIMATVFWEDILNFSLNSQNTYLIRESRNFISKLLERGVEQDEKFCTSVVKKIMCPLGDNVYQAMKTLTSDEDMCKSINPTLQMIGTILEYFLEKSMPGQKQFRVVLIFLENFHLEKRISDLLLIARNQYLLFDLGRVMFLMQFLELYINYVSLSTDIQNIHNSIKKIVDIFNVNLQRGNFDNVLKFSYFGQFYWNLLGSKLPCFMTEKQNEPLEFAHELTMILLFPLFYLMVKYCTKNMTSLEVELRYENDNVRSSFASTIFKSMSQDTMRILFIWRECLIRQPDLCEITTKSILYLLKSRKYIKKRELVVLVCQMLIYLLKDLAETMKNDEEKLRTLRVEGTFFALLLEGISTFLQDFKITWKDAIEVFDVLDITFGFLEMTSWSDKVVVKALNLIQISIDKYMAPNLAFLVDDSDNSTTGVLAPLLLSKLEDSSPDVKNAALEIVQTISKLSNSNLVRADPLFTEWIMKVVTLWHIGNKTPTSSLAAFTLNAASALSGDEIIFCSLNNNNFFVKLINVVKARDSEASSIVQLEYINLLRAFLEHKAGIEWIMVTVFWEDVFSFSLNSQNTCIIRESRNFMAKLLERSVEQDEKFCTDVVKKIMCPLGENVYQAMKNLPSYEDMFRNVSPTLQLIGTILEYFLENSMVKDLRVVLVFSENFHLEKRISDLLLIAENKYLLFDLGRIMFIMQFLELYINYITGVANIENIHCTIRKIMDVFYSNLNRGNFDNVMKFSYFGQFYWNLVGSKLPCWITKEVNEPLQFADQIIMIELMPLFCTAVRYCTEDRTIVQVEQLYETDDARYFFLTNLIKSISTDTMRIGYIWRDCLVKLPNLCEIVEKSLIYLLKSRKYIKRERVVIIFQIMLYLLQDVTEALKKDIENVQPLKTETTFYALLFEAITTFIQEFNITWKDVVETFDVLDTTFGFLEISTWCSKVVVKALHLVQISIAEYLAPNLAFLVDDTENSTTGVLAPLLLSKLDDSSADVRNATLEVVQTISILSNTKFPSLQKVLMDSDLPNLVVQMSTNDSESFVRATAIKCLQEMIQVEDIWNNVLKSQDLSQKMRNILLNETEGIVRVEAATFMCKAYEHQQFPEETLDKVYDTMIHSSTSDLHWEVKVRALGFWDQVITSQLHNQGMIDGTFPTVTFSKEHRKIVTLTDAEIKKRLVKVLNQLSSIGCLGVLTSAIKDDCDMEVSKTAVNITQRIVELLKKYNIQGEVGAQVSPQPTEHGMSSSTSVSSGISADDVMGSPVSSNPDINEEVIDQIVNSKDVTLLRSVYAPSDYGSVHNYDIQVKKIVTPNEFLIFTQQDLNVIITEKKNWLNGIEDLGSLLDDMLKTYDDDINNMDCY